MKKMERIKDGLFTPLTIDQLVGTGGGASELSLHLTFGTTIDVEIDLS